MLWRRQFTLGNLELWLVKRGYRAESVRREIQKSKFYWSRSIIRKTSYDSRRSRHVSFYFQPCFIYHTRYFKICSSNYRKFARKNCDIWNILEPGNEFKSTTTGEVYKIHFDFHCNSRYLMYLLISKICRKQYVGSTITKSRLRFNQYKSSIKL